MPSDAETNMNNRPSNPSAPWDDLERELQGSLGVLVEASLNQLSVAHRIVQLNAHRLLSLISFPERQYLFSGIYGKGQFLKMRDYFVDVTCQLHNFVASIKTLVDHSRKVVRKLHGEDLSSFPAYTQEVTRRFGSNVPFMFLQDLRNVTLHSRFPDLVAQYGFGSTGSPVNHQMNLKRDDLLSGFKWKGPVRKWLLNSPEYIEVGTLAREYTIEVDKFYGWLDAQLRVLHAQDLEIIRVLRAKQNSLRSEEIMSHLEHSLKHVEGSNAHPPDEIFVHTANRLSFARILECNENNLVRCERFFDYFEHLGVPIPHELKKRIWLVYKDGSRPSLADAYPWRRKRRTKH